MTDLRKSITTVLLSITLLPAMAQHKADTTYIFRFVAGKDMFYVPWKGNENELARLMTCIDTFRSEILRGMAPLYVDGYCSSQSTDDKNLAMAKIRSNRVKSELITKKGLTEDCFVTVNHAGGGNYVEVRIKVNGNSGLSTASEATDSKDETDRLDKTDATDRSQPDKSNPATDSQDRVVMATESAQADVHGADKSGVGAGSVALRFNLLRWVSLTPDLGLEWRFCPSWSILVNGSWTSWSWNDKDRRYALWEVMPEVRYYIGNSKAWYVGAMFKTGEFNYKLSGTGRQGDLMGGGLTGDCQLRLGKALSLDLGIGLGYLNADFEKYEVIDGVRVRRGTETKNWWGPINAGVTLVWKMR